MTDKDTPIVSVRACGSDARKDTGSVMPDSHVLTSTLGTKDNPSVQDGRSAEWENQTPTHKSDTCSDYKPKGIFHVYPVDTHRYLL